MKLKLIGMNRKLRCCFASLLLAVTLFTLSSAPLRADGPYLTPTHLDGVALLAPPPMVGSDEEAADLAAARVVFKSRTPAQTEQAESSASLSLFNFAPAIGSEFQPGKYPKMEALFATVKTNIADCINIPKKHWKRLRPCQVDPQLDGVGEKETSASYPSGHSTRGTLQALMLVELFPEKREAILAYGRQIGWDRVLIGKHFPTDVQAGRVLGQAIMRELMANQAFQHDVAAAKEEVRGRRAEATAAKK
jgi:acid phosphatase (class A)